MHGWYGYGSMAWMGFGWVFGLLLVGALIWALVGSRGGPDTMVDRRDSPEEILKRRYVKGEIDRETYQKMLSDLKG
jgi:putative membrane protein